MVQAGHGDCQKRSLGAGVGGCCRSDHRALRKSRSGTAPLSGSKELEGDETFQRGNVEIIWGGADYGFLLGCLSGVQKI